MENNTSLILSGMQVLTNMHWEKNLAVIVEHSKIKAIIPEEMISHHLPARHYTFAKECRLVPGFIDLHVHGAQGHDVMDGTQEALIAISRALAKEGVTGFLATTMTAKKSVLDEVLSVIADAKAHLPAAALLGIHLEGPFIAKDKMGAQKGEDVLSPNANVFLRWQKMAKGEIKLVTLAPELPDANELIQTLVNNRVIASVGHTNASYAETQAAIRAGCTHATHLFNAMRGLHQREPGAAGALLLSKEINAELIADGVHLHPAMLTLALCVKGKDRLVLVTDAMRAKCLGDGNYELGGQAVVVKNKIAQLANGTLAGSTLRMPDAIRNMTNFSGCELADAIAMASLNPARILGLDLHKGTIDVGKDADMVVLDNELEVLLTMREGEVIWKGN
jgi:N-acetylglucosamine-6-phosphate deacetylase